MRKYTFTNIRQTPNVSDHFSVFQQRQLQFICFHLMDRQSWVTVPWATSAPYICYSSPAPKWALATAFDNYTYLLTFFLTYLLTIVKRSMCTSCGRFVYTFIILCTEYTRGRIYGMWGPVGNKCGTFLPFYFTFLCLAMIFYGSSDGYWSVKCPKEPETIVPVIWQKAASPNCHPFLLWMDSSDLDPIWHMVHWTHMSPPPKRHLDRSTVFAQHVRATHRQTDHATCDIGNNRPHLMHCVQAMRCGLVCFWLTDWECGVREFVGPYLAE